MGKIYLGSDWHFSRFRKRTRSMKYDYVRSKDILTKYKEIVTDEDLFIFLGDLSYIGKKNTPKIDECLEKIRTLPGKKIMIKGNHDQSSNKMYRKLGFKYVNNFLQIDNVIFTHTPRAIEGNTINIHGHLHGNTRYYDDVKPYNHVDAFTGKFNNYPVLLEDLVYSGDFIDKSLIDEEFFEILTSELFRIVKD